MMLAILCAAGIYGQQQPVDTVIRTTTTLVEVRVVAVDSSGHAVTDLRREDFRVFDSGKPQPLRLFAPPRATASKVSTPATGEREPTPAGYAFLLLDWMNAGYGDRLRVQENVSRLLKTFEPSQKLGIYVLSRHSHLLHNFTTDREILGALVDNMDLDTIPVDRIWTPEDRVKETVRVLNMMASHLRPLPGRKSLVWLTSGFSMMIGGGRGGTLVGRGGTPTGRGALPPALFFQDVEKSLAKINAGDIAVYSIDASGLRVMPNWLFDDTLREVSRRTGGTAFADRNDLDEGMRRALEDAASSYTLGFHAPDDGRRGLHIIDVRVARPGVKLRYRETYDPAAGR